MINKIDAVKELRNITGISLAKCNQAIGEVFDTNLTKEQIIAKAFEYLRKTGTKIAADLSTRVAEEGKVCVHVGNGGVAAIAVNCQTDFVAMSEPFAKFVSFIAAAALENSCADINALMEIIVDGRPIREHVDSVMVQCGENIVIREIRIIEANANSVIGCYIHGNKGGVGSECGVVVLDVPAGHTGEASLSELANSIAMHIVGNSVKPIVLSADAIPQDIKDRELEIALSQPQFANLPAERKEIAVQNYMRKRFSELALLSQEYIMSDNQTIQQVIGANRIADFVYLSGKN